MSGHGVRSGGDGGVGLEWIEPLDPNERSRFVPPKYGVHRLGPARMIAWTPGGGGWGDAMHRDPAAVLRDVLDGVVSIQGARRGYGVVIATDGHTVDQPETETLRRLGR